MSQISRNIFLGDYRDAQNVQELKRKGITHVLSCAGELPQVPYPSSIKSIKLGLDDTEDENIDYFFEYTNKFIEDALNSGGKILVHCAAGISRSPTILAWYLMSKTGKSSYEVIAYLKSKRSIVNPNAGFKNILSVKGKMKRAGVYI